MEKTPIISRIPRWLWVVLSLLGVLFILFGLSLPVLDDLCGPTADQELQNKAPVFFWASLAIPVLVGLFLIVLSAYQFGKTRVTDNATAEK